MIIQNPYAKARKSAGGLTFSNWKGIPTARARVFENKSNTPKQIWYKNKFKIVTDALKILPKSFYYPSWVLLENKDTYINQRNSANLKAQANVVDPATPFVMDWLEMLLVKGDLEPAPSILTATYNDVTGNVNGTFSETVVAGGKLTDVGIAVAVNTVTKQYYLADPFTRDDEAFVCGAIASLTATDFYVYLAFSQLQADGTYTYATNKAKICAAA